MGRATSNRILALIVIAALVLSALAALVSSFRVEVKYSASTPEGVVQLYLTAIIEGKNDQAASYFASDSTCDASDIDRAYVSETLRVNLVSTSIDGDSAYVKIDANTGATGPFDDGYTESHTYRLSNESGRWLIEGIPWPLWDCGTINK
jgi:hypothetical protein